MDQIQQSASLVATSLKTDQTNTYAPYGKACSTCVKSKTRCVGSSGGGKCERCERLNKECHPAPTIRKKRTSKKNYSSSIAEKTTALEEKLEGLVQMLQRSQVPGIQSGSNEQQPPKQDFGSVAFTDCTVHSAGANPTNDFHNSESSRTDSGNPVDSAGPGIFFTCVDSKNSREGLMPFANGPPTPTASSPQSGPSTTYGIEDVPDTEEELEDCLKIYRTKMIPQFPIVCIPEETTAAKLKADRPFLFLVIRTICNKMAPRQSELITQVKHILAQEMLFEGTRDLDLLLGLLVFASWYHFFMNNKSILSTALHLAMSLAADLGLMKPTADQPANIMRQYIAQGCPRILTSVKSPRTIEERRAVIGLYLIGTVSANYFQRIEQMRWSPYMDECLVALDEKAEYPTDRFLVQFTRVQIICNKACASMWNGGYGDRDGSTRAPANLYMETLACQLNDLEKSLSPELKSNSALRLQIIHTNLIIHSHSLSTTTNPSTFNPTLPLTHLQNLSICFQCIKSWFDLFYDLSVFPVCTYPQIPLALLSQMAHCIITLYRLSVFDSTSKGFVWDREAIRRELDLGDVVQIFGDRWSQTPGGTGSTGDGGKGGDQVPIGESWKNSWFHTRNRVQQIVAWWRAKVAAGPNNEGLDPDVILERFGDVKLVADIRAEVDENWERVQQEEKQKMWESLGAGFGEQAPWNGMMDIDSFEDAWVADLLGGGANWNFEPSY